MTQSHQPLPVYDLSEGKKRAGRLFPRYARLAAVFVLSVVGFWALVLIAERLMLPDQVAPLSGFELAEVDTLPDGRLDDAVFIPIPDQNYSYKLGEAGRYAILRQRFSSPKALSDGASLLITRARDNVSVLLNGRAIGFEREGEDVNTSYMGPRLYAIPEPYLQEGENTLDIVLYGYQWPPRMHKAFVAPRADLVAAYNWRQFLSVDGINILSGIGLFLAFFAICVGFVSSLQRAEYISLGLVMLFWVGRNIYYTIPMHDWSLAVQSLFFNVTTFGMVMAIASFANAWARGNPKYYKVFGGVALLYPLVTFALDLIDTEIGDRIYLAVGLPLIALTILWTGYQQTRMFARRDFSLLAMVAFGACFAAGAVDVMGEILLSTNSDDWPISTTMPYTPLAIIVVAMGLIYSLVYRTMALQVSENRHRIALATELDEKTQALEASYEKTREQEKATAIAQERQRIMQDMHDGIGSQLLGLQFQIKQTDMTPAQVADELKNSLNDLRLIVDSLDTEADDVSLALGAFRARVQPQLSAANVDLEWKLDIRDEIAGFGPEAVLHIYRIMQEAVTNALRHSTMTRLSISMSRDRVDAPADTPSDFLIIRILDNGGGFDVDKILAGRGLANMQRRADALDADLSVEQVASGVSVFLKVPIPPESQAT